MELDAICTQCPLIDCDESSLWCVFRLLTDPNPEQRRVFHEVTPGLIPRPYHTRQRSVNPITIKRREYMAERYRLQKAKRAGAVPAR